MGSRKSRGRIPFLCLALTFLNLCHNWSPQRSLLDACPIPKSANPGTSKVVSGGAQQKRASSGHKSSPGETPTVMLETCVPLRSDHKLGEADLNSASWSLGKTSLKAYKSENGGVMVLRNSVTSDGFKLGSWVRDKRDSVTSDGFKLGRWVGLCDFRRLQARQLGQGQAGLCDFRRLQARPLGRTL